MSFKKGGLGKGLEALLADPSNIDRAIPGVGPAVGKSSREVGHHGVETHPEIGTSKYSIAYEVALEAGQNKSKEIVENSLSRNGLLQNLSSSNVDANTLSLLVRGLIEDVQKDNAALLETAEALLGLLNEIESLIDSQ